MADGVFNIAKGRAAELARNVDGQTPATSRLVAVALQFNAGFPTDDALGDVDTLADVLALANVAEATFTNYDRLELDNTAVTVTVDDTGNEQFVDIDDLTYTNAGGTTDNTLQKILICYVDDVANVDTDAQLTPLTHHDTTVVTDGSTVTYTIPANGFFGAT